MASEICPDNMEQCALGAIFRFEKFERISLHWYMVHGAYLVTKTQLKSNSTLITIRTSSAYGDAC